jgi:transposase
MAQSVRVRMLTEQERRKLQQVVRRGSTSSVRFRRAMMLLASAGGSTVPAIARLIEADKDTVRDVIHRFNEVGLSCLKPQWVGGRPRLLSPDDEDFVVQTATTRPTQLGKPFTRWSIRKLVDHLRRNISRPVRIGRETLRCLLARRGISFQRTRTWKESPDPDFEAELDRIEYAINERPHRTCDEFGPPGHPADRGLLLGRTRTCGPIAGHLPPHPRHHLLPRLHRPHLVSTQIDPRGPT